VWGRVAWWWYVHTTPHVGLVVVCGGGDVGVTRSNGCLPGYVTLRWIQQPHVFPAPDPVNSPPWTHGPASTRAPLMCPPAAAAGNDSECRQRHLLLLGGPLHPAGCAVLLWNAAISVCCVCAAHVAAMREWQMQRLAQPLYLSGGSHRQPRLHCCHPQNFVLVVAFFRPTLLLSLHQPQGQPSLHVCHSIPPIYPTPPPPFSGLPAHPPKIHPCPADVKAGVTSSRVNPRWPDSRNGHHPFTIEESRDCMLRR
jgi:hypothetical protein